MVESQSGNKKRPDELIKKVAERRMLDSKLLNNNPVYEAIGTLRSSFRQRQFKKEHQRQSILALLLSAEDHRHHMDTISACILSI